MSKAFNLSLVSLGMVPAIAETVKIAALAEQKRASNIAYIAGCLNLSVSEIETLLVNNNLDAEIVYERLQAVQLFHNYNDLTVEKIFTTTSFGYCNAV